MRKICLCVVGIFLNLFAAFAQSPNDSTSYISRKLTFEEANLVSSYYNQNGNNSAVTGGIGTEKLNDLSNTFDVKFIKGDKKFRKNSFELELGIDHYTSASSDKIDPYTISSASHSDMRIYPSFNWSRENSSKGSTIGAGLSSSFEFDYTSIGANATISKKTNDKNGELTVKGQVFLDKVSLIYPVELRQGNIGENGIAGTSPRNTYSGSISWSQIINQKLQIMLIADLVYQNGYLGLPFHRVYFNDNSVHIENLPDTRMKIPLGFRANYFLGDKVIFRSFYRYYHDDWGLNAHTVDLEASVKITPFFSVTPFYRFYKQTSVKYFSPYTSHKASDTYYTSNYDLSAFNSNFFGAGFRIAPPKGVFGWNRLSMLELRYGHYTKDYGMNANIISLHIKYK
jgi:hypothetical protein